MGAVGPVLVAPPGRRDALHDPARSWPETNCSVDLWIELISAQGHNPAAAMGFTVAQDFEGDQFTFFKIPFQELEAFFGLTVQELSPYDTLENHLVEQLARGRVVLVEVDSFYLPDTAGVSYKREHTKTTIGVNAIDPAAKRLDYFHSASAFALSGEDYDGLFGLLPGQSNEATLFPYLEFMKRTGPGLSGLALREAAMEQLVHHLGRRPPDNPVRAWGEALPRHLARLGEREPAFFHKYAFNTARQLGANFELLASHLAWLQSEGVDGLDPARTAAQEIAEGAKTVQFQLARAVARGRADMLTGSVAGLAEAYDRVIAGLVGRLGM